MNPLQLSRAARVSALVMASAVAAQAQNSVGVTHTPPQPGSNLATIFVEDDLGVDGKCRPEQRVYLRGRISGQSLFFCDVDAGDGASLSYTRNSVTGVTELTAQAGFGVRLGRKLSFGNRTRAGFIGYADLDSQTESTGQDQSQMRIGVDGGFITDFGNPRANDRAAGSLIYSIGAYYLTDVDFDAQGYGIRATAHPEIPRLRVNFKDREQNFHWDLQTSFEALKVQEAGSTGFASDTDFAWVALTLQGIYKAKPKAFPNGIQANFGSEYAKDLNSGDELHQFTAGAKMFLDTKERVALRLQHARGETRRNPSFVETTTLNFEFKF